MSEKITTPDPEKNGQVLPFKVRTQPSVQAFSNLSAEHSPVEDVSKYARNREDRGEYAHRMKMNALTVAILAVLVGGGIWIVDVMAQQRTNQDCVLSGRRNCSVGAIATPDR